MNHEISLSTQLCVGSVASRSRQARSGPSPVAGCQRRQRRHHHREKATHCRKPSIHRTSRRAPWSRSSVPCLVPDLPSYLPRNTVGTLPTGEGGQPGDPPVHVAAEAANYRMKLPTAPHAFSLAASQAPTCHANSGTAGAGSLYYIIIPMDSTPSWAGTRSPQAGSGLLKGCALVGKDALPDCRWG